jgi:hypothetical protein
MYGRLMKLHVELDGIVQMMVDWKTGIMIMVLSMYKIAFA